MRKSDHIKVLEKSTECNKKIPEAKKNYILKLTTKLEHSNTAPKTYWAILNLLMVVLSQTTTAKKQIFLITYIYIYVSICTFIKNNSVLHPLSYKTNTRINYSLVTNKDILSIIKSLDSGKSHGFKQITWI